MDEDKEYCDKLALTVIELTTGLNYNSKQSQLYLKKAKDKINKTI